MVISVSFFQHPVHNRFNILEYFRIRFRTAMFLILYIGHHCFILLKIAGYWLSQPLLHLDCSMMDWFISWSSWFKRNWSELLFIRLFIFWLICPPRLILDELGHRCFTAPMTNYLKYLKVVLSILINRTKCMVFNIYQRSRIKFNYI